MKMKIKLVLAATAVFSVSSIAQTGGLPTSISMGVSRVGSGVQAPQVQNQQYVQQTAAQAPQNQNQQQPVQQQVQQQVQQPNQNQGQSQSRAIPKFAPMPLPVGSPLTGASLANEAMDQLMPLTADEVRALRREIDVRKNAVAENVTGRVPVRSTTSIYNLDLSPGATPPVVRIEVGHGSIISFLDAAGKPWPAKVADNFSPSGLTLSQFTEHQLSVGTISSQPISAGVAVALDGVPVAITFTVISGQPVVDSQVHMVLSKYRSVGPPGVGTLRGEPSLTAGDLMSYLLRTPPEGARKLTVEGLADALAWQVSSDRMVLRTSAMVTTGAFRMQGIGDGTFAYEMPLSPQVRVIQGDRFNSIRIGGFMTGGQ